MSSISVQQPIGPIPTREPAYTWLLGQCLSESWQGQNQQGLAALVRGALAAALVHGPVEEARARLAQPLWMMPASRTDAPDIPLVDTNDVTVLGIEGKSRPAATQWSRLETYNTLTHGKDDLSRAVVAQRLAVVAAVELAPHADDAVDPDSCHCSDFIKTSSAGLHYPCIHQGDVYASTIDWAPAGSGPASPRDVTLVALLPSISSVMSWSTNLVTHSVWTLARVRSLHAALLSPSANATTLTALTSAERQLLNHLIVATEVFFDLATPSSYTHKEWVDAWKPTG